MADLLLKAISPQAEQRGGNNLDLSLLGPAALGAEAVPVVRKEGISTPASFEAGLRALILLNVMDAFYTLQWVDKGKADEANPIMALALGHGPEIFILSKIGLVLLAVALLWRHRDVLTARLALIPVAVLYAYVAGGHLGFALTQLLGEI